MTDEELEELKRDAEWEAYLDAKDMASNFEQEPENEGEENELVTDKTENV